MYQETNSTERENRTVNLVATWTSSSLQEYHSWAQRPWCNEPACWRSGLRTSHEWKISKSVLEMMSGKVMTYGKQDQMRSDLHLILEQQSAARVCVRADAKNHPIIKGNCGVLSLEVLAFCVLIWGVGQVLLNPFQIFFLVDLLHLQHP